MKLEQLPSIEPPDVICELVERYQTHHDSYLENKYNESQLRLEFLDPLFKSLGWDVYNDHGDAEAYKDVVHEDQVRVGGTTKAPDYCFRYGGVRKFFVEAKKPSLDIEDNPEPAYQLRRYAWSAKLPLSILTNFETFAVYDCTLKPDPSHKASIARVMLLRFQDYLSPEKWGIIAGIFHREAIPKGALEAFTESSRLKKGTTAVDQEFLKEIETWRDLLAHNIALRNSGLSQRELNISVQTTIDRIVFLRICEDRGIEPTNTLKEIGTKSQVYTHLFERFQKADERYNSGLFHFHKETDRTKPPDTLTPKLILDDKPLKDILSRLYYPESPYEFSVISAEILGQVYEQFLGKVIRLTKGHRAVVEEKPEVRKAGGVYYTPAYIVDYIIKETLGTLIEGKSPLEVGGLTETGAPSKSRRPVTVVDPACGSGSFLLEAYQFILDWYLRWYVNDGPEKWAKGKEPKIHPIGNSLARRNGTPPGWCLTTTERKRILLAHIHGVDIDPQAVEVTKLSLLLKVLEGESAETIETQQRLLHERALPDLESNIKCGNSLVGPDYYADRQQKNMFDQEELLRINAFDWNDEFAAIMKSGGFDAVVGNPPYVFGRDWRTLNISDELKDYFGKRYNTSPYQLDMFSLFMEKAFSLLKRGGVLGQIVPNVWLTNTYSSITRSFYLTHSSDFIIVLPPRQVFPGITVDTIVFTLKKSNTITRQIELRRLDQSGKVSLLGNIDASIHRDGSRPISTNIVSGGQDLLSRLESICVPWGEITHVTRGVHPYRTGGYGISAFYSGSQTEKDVIERPYHSTKPRRNYRPFIYGKDLKRYGSLTPTEYVNYGPWLAEPRDPEFFEGERIYSRKILGNHVIATLERGPSVADQQVYISKCTQKSYSVAYLLGLLTSRFMAFFIRLRFDETNQAFPQIKVSQLRQLPIHPIDFSNKAEKAHHDKMVSLVSRMLSLYQHLDTAQTTHEQNALKRQITATDREIDLLVYLLYDLSDEEIRMVEEEG